MKVLTKNAIDTLEKRYFKRDYKENIIETPKEMFQRVAEYVANAEVLYSKTPKEGWREKELWTEEFYWLMSNMYFLPNSPTLRHFGATSGCGSACFVLPIEDSKESIFGTLGEAAKVQSMGGGTGFSFNRLRHEGANVGNTGAVSTGPLSFMEIYSVAIEKISQGGARDGAMMGILNCNHPNIIKFINYKSTEETLQNFNISVAVTDEFMKVLNNNGITTLEWSGKIGGKDESFKWEIKAKEIWNAIIHGAWKNGEPGVVFIDTINNKNPLKEFEKIEATNPCGEQPLPPYDCCNLGSINLSEMIVSNFSETRPSHFSIEEAFDYNLFEKVIRYSVKFLDNVIDVNNYPLEKIEEKAKKNRRIGLGVMGFADMLIKLGVKYSSEEAIKWAENIGEFLRKTAYDESVKLANERGRPLVFSLDIKSKYNRRNGTVLSIAPTGTLSIIADCSSGIEPNFDVDYKKMALGKELKVVSPLWKPYIEKGETPPDYYETMNDIPPEQHVKILAAWQKYIDAGISKTINAPNNTTKEEVDRLFRMAHASGCKAITFYRAGSRKIEALTSTKKEKKGRPAVVRGLTPRINTGYGKLYVTMNYLNGKLFEVFAKIGKGGKELNCMTEAMGRLISLCCRSGIPVEGVIKQLKGIGGEKPIVTQEGTILSIPDAIGRIIEKFFCKKETKEENQLVMECPNCGETITPSEGCLTCRNCGYTKCGE